jgi:hypothetical protein
MWDKIRTLLSDHSDCDQEMGNYGIVTTPNKAMTAYCNLRDWKEGYPVKELDVVNYCLEVIEDMPNQEDYRGMIDFLNRRFFELT